MRRDPRAVLSPAATCLEQRGAPYRNIYRRTPPAKGDWGSRETHRLRWSPRALAKATRSEWGTRLFLSPSHLPPAGGRASNLAGTPAAPRCVDLPNFPLGLAPVGPHPRLGNGRSSGDAAGSSHGEKGKRVAARSDPCASPYAPPLAPSHPLRCAGAGRPDRGSPAEPSFAAPPSRPPPRDTTRVLPRI